MKIKAWVLAVAALAMTSIAGRAADLGGTPYVGVNNWSGFYVGANLGYAHSTTNISVSGFGGSVSADFSDSAFVGGLLAGYNWQSGNRLWGIEGDINFNSGGAGTIRGRYGVISGDMLYYGTAGIGFSDSASALVVGGGLETKINSHLSAGVEGLFYWYPDIASVSAFGANETVSANTIEVRARLTYRLGDTRDFLK